MARNPDYKQINLVVTEQQFQALNEAAAEQGVSEFIRLLLAEYIPNFPAGNIPRRGTYKRRKIDDK